MCARYSCLHWKFVADKRWIPQLGNLWWKNKRASLSRVTHILGRWAGPIGRIVKRWAYQTSRDSDGWYYIENSLCRGKDESQKNKHSSRNLLFSFSFCSSSHVVKLPPQCQELVPIRRATNLSNMMDTPTSSTSSNNNNSRQVILEGGLPWGFRIQGGSDTGVQLRIARVSIIPTQSIICVCSFI